ncbi:MAG: hypothetical protein IJ189_09695 [Clostridia bacterium]|nr:hypothetical protein [Clostridia bacterium]
MKKWRSIWQRYMLRPFLYMAFSRLMVSLAAVLLANFFLSPAAGRSLKSTLFLLCGVLFAALAWIAFLRLDGAHLPQALMLRFNPGKKPKKQTGDIIDFIDEEPRIAFEDLDDEEKDACILGANLICCGIYLVVSLVV